MPARVLEVLEPGPRARVEMGSGSGIVSLALLTGEGLPGPGDFVLVHAGMAVARVDEEEARQIAAMLEGFGEPVEVAP